MDVNQPASEQTKAKPTIQSEGCLPGVIITETM
jgi:hypothetical protein